MNKFESSSTVARRILFAASLAAGLGFSSLALGQTASKGSFSPLAINVPSVVQRSSMVGSTSPSQVVHLSINLLPPNPAALQSFADSVSDPKSPNYQRFITPAQVGQMFGQPSATVQKIVSYLSSQGFTIKLVAKSNLGILADATVSQAEAAFNTHINNYHALNSKEPGRLNYYSFSETPQMPSALAPAVLSIEGLENFTKPQPRADPLTPTQTRVLYSSAPIYNSGLQGQNRHVAISSWDGYRLTNVPLYYKAFGLPTPVGGVGSNITVVTIDGGSGAGTPGGEADVDIQMVLGMAPLTNFIIYDGGGGLTDVLTKEADDNLADIISESYGWDLQETDAIAAHNLHLMMTAQGITYMAAAGDSGTSLEPYAYPDYDPEVLIVGGTQAQFDSQGNRLSEPCWQNGGGGWCTDIAPFNILPSWQKGRGVPTGVNARLVPDVAFNASGNDTGAFQFFFNGALDFGEDGTSFASPLFAGLLSVVEQQVMADGGLASKPHRFGRMQDLIYGQNGRSDAWFDVTEGSNGSLPNGQLSVASVGWDFASGWGCMIMTGFVKAVAVTPPTVYPATSASVFDDTFANPSITEGNYVSGTPASLAAVDQNCYIVSPVNEVGIGRAASVQANFSTNLKPTTVASLNIAYTGYLPAAASVMIYVYNWTTNTYDLMKTYSGTQSALANTIAIPTANVANYVSSKGAVQVVARSLVPTDRGATVGSYTFEVDQLVISGTAVLTN